MRTALVTGGSRGIGRAIALELVHRGITRLAITARTEEKLSGAKGVLEAAGAKVLAFQADVRDHEAMAVVIAETVKVFGGIDVLVNNAGVARRKTFLQTSRAEWDEIIDVNLKGVLVCTALVLQRMVANGKGVIINIASGAGKAGFPELSVYCASKFGVVGFTESLAKEVSTYGVRVYAVCPGSTDTRMYRSLYPEREPAAEPEDVARVVGGLVAGELQVSPGRCVDVY
ncbi:MAG: SDR family oxidoreductase [Bacillota bacterium]